MVQTWSSGSSIRVDKAVHRIVGGVKGLTISSSGVWRGAECQLLFLSLDVFESLLELSLLLADLGGFGGHHSSGVSCNPKVRDFSDLLVGDAGATRLSISGMSRADVVKHILALEFFLLLLVSIDPKTSPMD